MLQKGIRIIFVFVAGIVFTGCNDDLILEETQITTDVDLTSPRENIDVVLAQHSIKSFNGRGLPLNFIGKYTHPKFGTTEASITAQILLSSNDPVFGGMSQEDEEKKKEGSEDELENINEEETVTSVYLYIPFYKNGAADADNDGVIDSLDAEPNDGSNDTDGDTIPNNVEKSQGTDPNSADTDGDGINDNEDKDTVKNNFPVVHDLDSIYGDIKKPIEVKVHQMNYFLRDFDVTDDFKNFQEYSTDFDFGAFRGEELGSASFVISNKDYIEYKEDDPETEDVDESKTVDLRLEPGIRIPLSNTFFQENLLNKEGQDVLFNNNAWKNFVRGITISANLGGADELMPALNLAAGKITVNYDYKKEDTKNTKDTSDDEIVTKSKSFSMSFSGNRVNSLKKTAVPLPSDGNIYLNGGLGHYASLAVDFDPSNPLFEKIRNKVALLNEANLVLHVNQDEMNALNVEQPLRLYLYLLDKDNKPAYTPAQDKVNSKNKFKSFLVYDGKLEKDDNDKGLKYRIRVTSLMNETLIRTDNTNLKFGLAITSNINLVNSFNGKLTDDSDVSIPLMHLINPLGTVLYGTDVPSGKEDKKLQLELIYTPVK